MSHRLFGRFGRGFVVCLVAAIALTLACGQALATGNPSVGAVYTQTNTAPNYVQSFNRAANGTLTAGPRYRTGGDGKPAGNPPLDIPFLDSAGSVELSDDGRFLFVVNAGNNTVSSFRVGPRGLTLADVKPTFGSRPVSATSSRGLLYVLNSDVSASGISGYYVTPWGALIPIAGSVRPTSSPTALPGQIEFDPTGSLLVVSERLTGTQGVLSTYTVGFLGRPGPAVPHASTGKGPFGIAFGHRNVMVVSNEHFPDVLTSTVSSYGVSRGGNVTPIANVPANAGGACWTVITDNGKLAYVTSPFTSDINGFRIGNDGSLTGVTPSSVVAHSDGLTLDEALSHNSRYLYVLISAGFASARVDAFAINNDGTIKLIGSSPSFEGSGSGTAAW